MRVRMTNRKNKTEYPDTLKNALVKLITDIIVIAGFAAITFTFVFGVMVQKGNDMYPAVRDGDVLIYYRRPSLVQTEAVVYEEGGDLHSGRIAAAPGSVISETGDHQLTFNGIFRPVDESSGIYSKTFAAPDQELPLTVSSDGYYILNDDRRRLTDSRIYGEINRKAIKGRIITILRRRTI